jgi:hypothetical protein
VLLTSIFRDLGLVARVIGLLDVSPWLAAAAGPVVAQRRSARRSWRALQAGRWICDHGPLVMFGASLADPLRRR